MASIFDILGEVVGGGMRSGGSLGSSLGGTFGNILDSLSTQAKSAQNTFNNNITQKGGLGSMLGAGALGALLGNVAGGNLLKNAALLGAGAVALNFYKKWAAGKQQQSANQQTNYQAQASQQNQPSQQASVSQLPRLDQPTVELITRAMVYAAKSDGNIDNQEREAMEAILANMLPGENSEAMIGQIEKEQIDPGKIASSVKSKEQGEDVYRLSCSVIDIDQFMERAYMDALAKSLGINDGEKNDIEKEAKEARQQLMKAVNPA